MDIPAGTIAKDRSDGALLPAKTETSSAGAPQASGTALPYPVVRDDPLTLQVWQFLESRASLPTQSHAYCGALAGTLVEPGEIKVFASGSPPCALLPLWQEPGLFGRLRVVGEHSLSEPCDALIDDASSAEALAEVLVREKRAVDLDRVPANSPLLEALRRSVGGKAYLSVRPALPTPVILLDKDWCDPVSRFGSRRRSDFRRAMRKADELGFVSFEMLSPDPEQFDQLFDEAIGVEMRSWKRDCGTAIGADRSKEAFFRAYFRAASERGEFRLAFMRVDGRVVAMQMAIETLHRYWLFKIGFDEEYARGSPGTLLMLHTIGWAAEKGLLSYELLGQVEPWIAQLWTRSRHECVRVRVFPFNFRGAVAIAADVREWLRTRMSPFRT